MSGFIGRWASRKEAARKAEEAAENAPLPVAPDAAPEGESPAPQGDELAALLRELPDLETITSETDIRPFLQSFVPQALKNAALRRAWALDPVISTHLDVARDYAWDFNAGSGPEGFYPNLAKEIADRSLEFLKGTAPVEPDPEAALPPPPEVPVALAPPAAEEEQPEAPARDAAPRRGVLLSQRHGGALPG